MANNENSKEGESSPNKKQAQGVKANIGNKWSLGALNKHL